MSDPKKPVPPAPAATHPAPAPARFIAAAESRFASSAEFKEPTVWYCPEAGTPFEHLLQPEYWASIRRLHAGCHIYVHAEDGSYWAHLFVDRVGQGYADVLVFDFKDLPALRADRPKRASSSADGYEIEFRGPITKWRVVRTKDHHELKRGLDTEDEARLWLRDHKRMLAN